MLECPEVPGQQQIDWCARGPRGADPAAQRRCAEGLLRLGQQGEQDRQLRLVIEVAGDDLERIRVEHGQQLLVGEAQQLLQARGVQS
jgi:hypothetical protein